MIHELDIETLTKLVVRKINEIGNREIVLQNPTDKSVFPCTVVRAPMERPRIGEGATPVYTRFSISTEEWANTQYECMTQAHQTTLKLREYNFKKVSNDIPLYDEITKKYRLISNYEVNYNGLTNSFELIK